MRNLRLVSRGLEQIVNYSIKFKRVADLTNDMCDEILWRKKIQKNLLKFKQSVSAEFRDDPKLQLFVKYRLSSIFDRVHLCQIFGPFAYCKRICDSEKTFCRMCSSIYPDHLIDDLYLFDEIIIDSCFTAKFVFGC